MEAGRKPGPRKDASRDAGTDQANEAAEQPRRKERAKQFKRRCPAGRTAIDRYRCRQGAGERIAARSNGLLLAEFKSHLTQIATASNEPP